MDKQDNFLSYSDDRLIITGKIIKHNDKLHLRFTVCDVKRHHQELVQLIPVEFLSGFDYYMFNAVFRK